MFRNHLPDKVLEFLAAAEICKNDSQRVPRLFDRRIRREGFSESLSRGIQLAEAVKQRPTFVQNLGMVADFNGNAVVDCERADKVPRFSQLT